MLSVEGVAGGVAVVQDGRGAGGQGEVFSRGYWAFDFFTPMRIPWQRGPGDISAALAGDGWSAVTPALAERFGWSVGDAFEVQSGVRQVRLRVGALVDFQALSPVASRKLVVMDIAQAQALLGRKGQIHQIDVRVRRGRGPRRRPKAIAGEARARE